MAQHADLQQRLETAIDASWRAGQISLAHYQTGVAVQRKADGTPVTIADHRVEAAIRERLAACYPDDSIVGEEGGVSGSGDEGRWIIDPIDGTAAFIRGVPFYAVLLAYETRGEVLLGVMNFPAMREMVWAGRGLGCYWNGRRARVSFTAHLHEATLLCTDFCAVAAAGYASHLQQLCQLTAMQRTWGDAYGHALVATGRADIMIDPKMELWDCGPLLPILEEAGGRFTTWEGIPTISGNNALSTNGVLHQQLLDILSKRQ